METLLPLFLALAADALLGDPPSWPHFVRWQGKLIAWLETMLRATLAPLFGLRLAGVALVGLVVGGSFAAAWLALKLAWSLAWPLGMALASIMSFQCLAAGQLWREARNVSLILESGDLPLARQRLAMIVGRDTAGLDAEGIRRAVIETVAENLNDGLLAPLFYLTLGGPALGVAYKAVNTLDSMVGYRDERYAELGWAAARLDDLAGWLPARLTALLVTAVAPLLGLDPAQTWRAVFLYHGAHKSPNSGWPEAAFAGALGVRLGGPNTYSGVLVEKPWINPQGRAATADDLRSSLDLLIACTTLAGAVAILLLFLLRGWL